jgi:arylsulfatase A-like enzyme
MTPGPFDRENDTGYRHGEMRRRNLNSLPLLLVLCTGLCGNSAERTSNAPNILLITIDAQRADHFGLYGYRRNTTPNIAKWFRHATLYENAYSTESQTPPAIVSLLTGTLPQVHRIRLIYQKAPADMMMIPDYLSKKGYQTAGIVANMVLTREAIGLDTHFDYYDDYLEEKELYRKIFERNARGNTDAALLWSKLTYDPEQPYFLWIHYQDPHGPYFPPADKPIDFTHAKVEKVDPNKIPEYQRHPGITDGNEFIDLYDEEIAYMDFHVGRLLSGLDARNMLDNTIVILTADHGESMMDHEVWFNHNYHVYNEFIHIPLLILRANGKRKTVKTPVSILDIAPTIYNITSVSPAEKLIGQVLDDSIEEKPIYSEATDEYAGLQWRSMIYKSKKWMVKVLKENRSMTDKRLYQLAEDPKERKPKSWNTLTPETAQFLQLIKRDPDPAGIPKEYAKGKAIQGPKERPELNDHTIELLRSIGYTE